MNAACEGANSRGDIAQNLKALAEAARGVRATRRDESTLPFKQKPLAEFGGVHKSNKGFRASL